MNVQSSPNDHSHLHAHTRRYRRMHACPYCRQRSLSRTRRRPIERLLMFPRMYYCYDCNVRVSRWRLKLAALIQGANPA